MSGSSVLRSIRLAGCGTMLAGLLLPACAFAQDTSVSTTSQSGDAKVTTNVEHGKVVYVSGNELLVKADDGQVKHFVVPDSARVTVDGKQLSVHQLQPGMSLTRTITTTTVPKTVSTVRTIEGKVWYVNAPNTVILQFPDGTNKQYKIPSGQKFMVDGQMQTAFHLKKGMNVSATVVTDEPMTVASQSRSVTGTLPPPPQLPPAPPANTQVVLLIEDTRPMPAAAAAAPVQTAKATLPKTASDTPLIGIVGSSTHNWLARPYDAVR
jgi:hypothetical protein